MADDILQALGSQTGAIADMILALDMTKVMDTINAASDPDDVALVKVLHEFWQQAKKTKAELEALRDGR